MGRIKTAAVKRVSLEMFNKYKDKFSSKFNDNKKILDELADIRSNRLRNMIAGYITRLVKRKDKLANIAI